jgi:hypothetical protein
MRPALRVGLFMPDLPPPDETQGELSAETTGADFIARTLAETAENGFADTKPVKIKGTPKRLGPRKRAKSPSRKPVEAAAQA